MTIIQLLLTLSALCIQLGAASSEGRSHYNGRHRLHADNANDNVNDIPIANKAAAAAAAVPSGLFQSCTLTLAGGATVGYCQNNATGACTLGQGSQFAGQITSNTKVGTTTFASFADCCAINGFGSMGNQLNGVIFCTNAKFLECRSATQGAQCNALPGFCPTGFVGDQQFGSLSDCCNDLELIVATGAAQCAVKQYALRLAGPPGTTSGYVEIFANGLWGTICDDDFDEDTAKAVCRFMGLPSANADWGSFSDGSLDQTQVKTLLLPFSNGNSILELQCDNTETSIDQCSTFEVQNDCHTDENVVVFCM